MTDQLTIRRAGPDDLDEVVGVCGQALEWSGDDDAAFFRWTHVANAFGPSPIWVAEDGPGGDRRIVGVRAMMRWAFVHPAGGERQMARAVDTATLPSHQGRGIFSKLTMAAVEELTADGVAAVFNTPNDKSRPGYLKMGWDTVGQVPVTVRPRHPMALVAMVRNRVAADRWGIPTTVGVDPEIAFADDERLATVLDRAPAIERWATPLTVDYLRWRTSFSPLACRVEYLGDGIDDGFVVFRLRRRGGLRQLSVLHVVRVPSSEPVRRAIGRVIRLTQADGAMAAGGELGLTDGMLPAPSTGPLLTWRVLADPGVPAMSDLYLPLGALELF